VVLLVSGAVGARSTRESTRHLAAVAHRAPNAARNASSTEWQHVWGPAGTHAQSGDPSKLQHLILDVLVSVRVRIAEAEEHALAEGPHDAVLISHESVSHTGRRRRNLYSAQPLHPPRRQLVLLVPMAELATNAVTPCKKLALLRDGARRVVACVHVRDALAEERIT